MWKILLFPFFAFVILVHSVLAQPQLTRDPQALGLLAQAHAVIGSDKVPAFQAERGILVVGNMKHNLGEREVVYPFRAKILDWDSIRWEVDTPEGTRVTVIRGNSGWSKSTSGTIRLPVSQIPGKSLESFPFLAIQKWLGREDYEARDLGTESHLESVVLRRLSVGRIHRGAGGNKEAIEEVGRCELLLDQQTYLPARVRYFEHGGDWRIATNVDLVYSDYRMTNGIAIPFRIRRTIRNRILGEIEIISIGFQVPISTSEFQEK